jgi:hypothetical protein
MASLIVIVKNRRAFSGREEDKNVAAYARAPEANT